MYDILVVPVVLPVTMPVNNPIVATPGLLLDHVPPVPEVVSVFANPEQDTPAPIIGPASAFTVTVFVL
jgi:hypothetical protein